MKVYSLVSFGVLSLALAGQTIAGQIGGGAPALGGRFASRGMAHPLGGISSGPSRGNYRGGYASPRNVGPPVFPYAYSWYVPNYFDWDSTDLGSAYPPAPPVVQAQAPPQPPVVINQFFGPPPQQAQIAPAAPAGESGDLRPGDPIGTVDNYYLIAYKNHQVYAALAYWVEDSTLHYVTTENTHNQASLSLIDLDLTKTLNQARNVPFSIQSR